MHIEISFSTYEVYEVYKKEVSLNAPVTIQLDITIPLEYTPKNERIHFVF